MPFDPPSSTSILWLGAIAAGLAFAALMSVQWAANRTEPSQQSRSANVRFATSFLLSIFLASGVALMSVLAREAINALRHPSAPGTGSTTFDSLGVHVTAVITAALVFNAVLIGRQFRTQSRIMLAAAVANSGFACGVEWYFVAHSHVWALWFNIGWLGAIVSIMALVGFAIRDIVRYRHAKANNRRISELAV